MRHAYVCWRSLAAAVSALNGADRSGRGHQQAIWVPAVHAHFLDLVLDQFELVDLRPEDVRRMAELVRLYEDARLDPADVSVVAIAERLHIVQVVTLDRRDFCLVRPRHISAFRLLPE
ncbi:PIN domain-containing protein [Thermoactinospora rubra]|uniref:PIN domain-containing protein n=1 Tax=Thermoactinospora rubra TaxID=1088767 RepID=UPI00117F051F